MRRIALDLNNTEITLAIRDALHPVSGHCEEHFVGMREGSLKQILRNRFGDLKKDREKVLRRGKQPDWSDNLVLNRDGTVKPLLANLELILREQPEWKGVLGFDEFGAHVVTLKRPPWEGEVPPGTPWSDHFDTKVRMWFQREARIFASMGDVGRAVQAAAKENAFNPACQYFNGIVWDGTPRLDTWLVTYFHAEDTPYIPAIGPRYLISAVARVFEPGCKVDHTLVVEGPQGKLKSEALRILAIRNEWFVDRLSNLASKDAAQELAGVLIVEIGEMDALVRTTSSTAKAYLTRTHDRIRLPYGRHLTSRARQNIFAATINPPVGGYLRDPTGDRRFWPAACHGTIDLDALKQDRDQLWAEAVHRFKAGAKWWLPPELEALATAEQRTRFKADAWEAPVVQWLGDRPDASIHEVLEQALGIPCEQHTQSAENRVVRILTRLGLSRYRPNKADGDRRRRYQRNPVAEKVRE